MTNVHRSGREIEALPHSSHYTLINTGDSARVFRYLWNRLVQSARLLSLRVHRQQFILLIFPKVIVSRGAHLQRDCG